jgi:hypothetical protein
LCSRWSEAQRLQGFARKSSEVLSVSSKLRSGRPQWAIFSLISIFDVWGFEIPKQLNESRRPISRRVHIPSEVGVCHQHELRSNKVTSLKMTRRMAESEILECELLCGSNSRQDLGKSRRMSHDPYFRDVFERTLVKTDPFGASETDEPINEVTRCSQLATSVFGLLCLILSYEVFELVV